MADAMGDGGAASRHSRPKAAEAVQTGNLVLRFLLELATLAALAYWGVHTGRSVLADVVLGLGAPLLAAVAWGTWAAPKSARRLHGAPLLVVQLGVLGSGAAALVAAGHPVLGVAMAVVIAVNAMLLRRSGGD